MIEKGSRNVSLGPYRSTELALEERLTKEEAKEMAILIESEKFGVVCNWDYNLDQVMSMLLALGYTKESRNLFVSKSSRFVYLSGRVGKYERKHGNLKVISGNYHGALDEVVMDMDIMAEMEDFHDRELSRSNSLGSIISFLASVFGGTFGLPMLSHYLGLHDSVVFLSMLAGAGIGFAAETLPGFIAYRSKMKEKAHLLSRDVNNYSFGKKVYDQIISDYYNLTIPKLPEAPLFELPESKENKQ